MTTEAGCVLVDQVVPLLTAIVGRGAVKPIGCEDHRELVAEGVALAAAMLASAEASGKEVSASSLAHYAAQSLKAGRRTYGAGRQDALSAAAALDGRVAVGSLDAEFGASDAEDGDTLTLHDVLGDGGDCVSEQVARRMDWALVDQSLDRRSLAVVRETACGYGPSEIGKMVGVTPPRIVQIKRKAAEVIDGVWGEGQWREALKPSAHAAGKRAAAAKRACRAERAA